MSDPTAVSGDTWLAPTRDLIRFIDASPTPYHAIAEVVQRLSAAGFSQIDERDHWKVSPGDKRYIVKSGGSIVAFEAGNRAPAESGFLILGAHTDSPNFRVKPQPDISSVGYRQIGVEVYGGVLLTTWMDRDLSIAGRVSLVDGKSHLVSFETAVCRIPNLAIHLNRGVNKNGLVLNAETQMRPILAMEMDTSDKNFVARIAAKLEGQGVKATPNDIAAYDLCLFDTQGGAVGGADAEYLHSARLDNLASCHASVEALLGAGDTRDATRIVVLYDHEEVGSRSDSGAQSRFLLSVLERVAASYGTGDQAVARALARSMLVSADMAHAVHPNYADKHDGQHQPKISHGPVLKINASQSYATDGPAAAVFEAACQAESVKPQRFVSRSDMPCGSTIGPISAARTGIRTVDVGNPMLSMHSCRETSGTRDVDPMIRVMKRLFREAEIPAPSN